MCRQNCLTVYNGEFIAGGGFWYAGGVPARRITRWDGFGEPMHLTQTGQLYLESAAAKYSRHT